MGTPGHMAHPFGDEDHPSLWLRVKTGQDLLQYFQNIKEFLELNPGSLKTDGINVSFKLITTEGGEKEFRMDRGTTYAESVVGMTAEDAYKKWPEGHGMPHAIKTLLEIFNEALSSIQYELKDLGMWDNPQKFFNTEYVEGKTNVQQYDKNFLAIHGINQFYEKKAPKAWVSSGKSMDRKGLKRPIGPKTGKPVKDKSVEIPYNRSALESLIKKVKPIASQRGFEIYGDIPTQLIAEIDYTETLGSPFTIQMTAEEQTTHSLSEWLEEVHNPKNEKVTKANGTTVPAIGKDVYMAVINHIPLTEYLKSPEDVKRAISGAIFNHATRMLGNDVKAALDSSMGSVTDHEGVVLRGMEDFPIKVTGEFIVGGLQTAFREGVIKEAEELKGIKDVEEMYNIETVDPDEEKGKKEVALIPGGFKPPHKGHLALITHYLDEVAPNGKIILYMGSGGKNPRTIHGKAITYEDSLKIWKIYFNNENIAFPNEILEIREVKDAGPIGAVIDYVKEANPEREIIYLGAGKKDGERWKFMLDNPKYNPNNVKVFIEPIPNYNDSEGKPMSAENFRAAIESGDEELIKSYIPKNSHKSYREIMEALEPRLKESQLPLGIFLRLIEEQVESQLSNPEEVIKKYGTTAATKAYKNYYNKYIKGKDPEKIAGIVQQAELNIASVKEGLIKSYSTPTVFTTDDIEDIKKKALDTDKKRWVSVLWEKDKSKSIEETEAFYNKNYLDLINKTVQEAEIKTIVQFDPNISPEEATIIYNSGQSRYVPPKIYLLPLSSESELSTIIKHEIEHAIKEATTTSSFDIVQEQIPLIEETMLTKEEVIKIMQKYWTEIKEQPFEYRETWAKLSYHGLLKRIEKFHGGFEEIRSYLKSYQDCSEKSFYKSCLKKQKQTKPNIWVLFNCRKFCGVAKKIASADLTREKVAMVSENFLNIIEETINETPVSDMTNMFGFASGLLEPITPGGFSEEEEIFDDRSIEGAAIAMIDALTSAAKEFIKDEDKPDLEEISAMAAGAAEGGAQKRDEKEEETLIREVEDYLFSILGVNS